MTPYPSEWPAWLDRRLALAVCVPAIVAFALVLALFPRGQRAAPIELPQASPAKAAHLAHEAEQAPPALHPIVVQDGQPRLGSDPGGPISTHARPAPPRAVAIPALGVRAPIQPVGNGPHGIDVPHRGQAGWWSAGARPGEPGRAVLIGHLDSPVGPDVFGRVPALKRGALITVADAAGRTHRFRVVGKLEIEKARFPRGAVYGTAARPVLVLITCGGPYIPGFGYRDNIIVYARAAGR